MNYVIDESYIYRKPKETNLTRRLNKVKPNK